MTSPLKMRVAAGAAFLVLATLPHRGEAQLQFYNLATPCRAVDTRSTTNAPAVPASTERKFTIKGGACPVPTDAKTVALNLTVTSATNDGFIFLWPTNGTIPPVSNINFLANQSLSNGAVVPLYAAGTPDLSLAYGTGSGTGTVHVILDVTGYFK